MGTDLYRVSQRCWIVKSDMEYYAFDTIEKACDFLESLKIPSDEIDEAIIYMTAQSHVHAQFGALEGRFMYSDDEKFDIPVGFA